MRPVAKFQHMRGVMLKQDKLQCGLCHSHHDTREAAQSCVYRCLIKRNSPQPVQQMLTKKSRTYRCTYCCREYSQLSHAKECVASCLEDYHTKLKNIESQKADDDETLDASPCADDGPASDEQSQVDATAVLSEDDKFFRDQAKYACKTCQKTYFSKAEVVACFDDHTS